METFLPSEIARLVLGYLKDENCMETSQVFLRECTHLSEYVGMLNLGREFSTEVLGKSLKMILDEYGNFQLSKKAQVSSAGLSNLWDRYEMLGCQLRHTALSLQSSQLLPVAGKQTADSLRSYSHKQALRNRCRHARNQSAIVRSDVSVVLTSTNTSAHSTVAAAPGMYYLISAVNTVNSSPCIAIVPENRNPLAPSTSVQATMNPAGSCTASTDALNVDGRESSCFDDDLESLASGDGASSGFQNTCTGNDDREVGTVAASENSGLRQRFEAVEVIQSKNEVPLSHSLSPLRSRGAVNSSDLHGSPSCQLSTTSVLSGGSTGLQIDTSYTSTPKTSKSRRQKRVKASSVTKTPTEISEPKSVGHYHLRSSVLASKLPSTPEQSLKQPAELSLKKPCSSSNMDPGATLVAASTPRSVSNGFPNQISIFSDSPSLCERDPTIFSETMKMKHLDFLSPVKSLAESDSLPVTVQEAKGSLTNEKVVMSEHSKCGTLPKPSRTTGNSRMEACSADTRIQTPLKPFHHSRDRRKKAQPYKKKVSPEQASYLVPGGSVVSAQQHQSIGACAAESAASGDLGLDADVSQLLERLIKSQTFAEQIAKNINDHKLSKSDSAVPLEDSDKRASSSTESLCSGHGKSEIGLTEAVKRTGDDSEFISDGVGYGGSDVVDVNSTSEVVPDGKHTGDVDAGIHKQGINEDCSHETSAALSMLDIDLMTDVAIDNILKELCSDPTLDSITNGSYSNNHDNRPNPNFSHDLINHDEPGQLEFSHDFSDFLAQHTKLESDAGPVSSRSELEELSVITNTLTSSAPVFPKQSSSTGDLPPFETDAIATETKRQFIRVFTPGYGVVPDQIDILEVIGSGVEVDDEHSSGARVTRAAPDGAEMDAELGGSDRRDNAVPTQEERVEERTLGVSLAKETAIPDFIEVVPALEKSEANVQKSERQQLVELSLKSESDYLATRDPVGQTENMKTSTKNLKANICPAVNAETVVPRRVVPKFLCSATSNRTSFFQLPCASVTSNQRNDTCHAKKPPLLETMLDEIGDLDQAVDHSAEKTLLTAVRKDSSLLEIGGQLTNHSPYLTKKSTTSTDSSSIIVFASPSLTSRSAPCTEAKAGGSTVKPLPKDKHKQRGMLAKQCRILGRNRARLKDASCGLSRLANVENVDGSKSQSSKSIIRFSEPSPIIDLTNTTNSSETSGDRFRIDVDSAGRPENGSRTKSKEQERNLPTNLGNNTCISATKSTSNQGSMTTTVKDIDNRNKSQATDQTRSSNLNGVGVVDSNHSNILPDLTDSDSDLNISSGIEKFSERIKTLQLGVKILKDEAKKKAGKDSIDKKTNKKNIKKESRRKTRVRDAAKNAVVDDDVIDVGAAVVNNSSSKSKKSSRGRNGKGPSKKRDGKKTRAGKMSSGDTDKKSSKTKRKKHDLSAEITDEGSPIDLRQYLERNLFKAKRRGMDISEPDFPPKSEGLHNHDYHLRIKFAKKKSKKEGKKEKKKMSTPSEGQVFSLPSVTLLDRAQKVRQPSDSKISCKTLLSMPSSFDSLLMSSVRSGTSVDDGVNENPLSGGCVVPQSCTDIAVPDKQGFGDQLSSDVQPTVVPGSVPLQGQLSEEETAVNALLLLADDMATKNNVCRERQASAYLSDDLVLKDVMPQSVENSLDDMLYDYVATGCSDVVLDLSRKKHDVTKDDSIDLGLQLYENSHTDVPAYCENTPNNNLHDSEHQLTKSTSVIDLNEAAKRLDVDCATEKSTVTFFSSPNIGIVLRIDKEEALKSPSTPSTSDCVPDENSSSFGRKRERSTSSLDHPKRVSRKRLKAMNIESFLSQVHP